MEPITISHKDYEKISDIVYNNGRLVIKLNVKLTSYSDNKGRISYHREVGYFNEKAKEIVYNINRQFDYFLSIEDYKGSNYIMIGINQYMSLVSMLDDIFKWFIDSKFHGLFARKDDRELVVARSVKPVRIDYLPMGKWLEAIPKAIEFPNGDYATGLRLYLSSYESYVDITFDELQGMIYILRNFNMFIAAQNMINYLQRPEFGTNLYSMQTIKDYGSIDDRVDQEQKVKGVEGRKVATKNTSFFDKMNDLRG